MLNVRQEGMKALEILYASGVPVFALAQDSIVARQKVATEIRKAVFLLVSVLDQERPTEADAV